MLLVLVTHYICNIDREIKIEIRRNSKNIIFAYESFGINVEVGIFTVHEVSIIKQNKIN